MKPAPDQLAPFREAIWKAQEKMNNAQGYPAWRNAQADYNEAREDLRNQEYRLNPAACDRHYLTRY